MSMISEMIENAFIAGSNAGVECRNHKGDCRCGEKRKVYVADAIEKPSLSPNRRHPMTAARLRQIRDEHTRNHGDAVGCDGCSLLAEIERLKQEIIEARLTALAEPVGLNEDEEVRTTRCALINWASSAHLGVGVTGTLETEKFFKDTSELIRRLSSSLARVRWDTLEKAARACETHVAWYRGSTPVYLTPTPEADAHGNLYGALIRSLTQPEKADDADK